MPCETVQHTFNHRPIPKFVSNLVDSIVIVFFQGLQIRQITKGWSDEQHGLLLWERLRKVWSKHPVYLVLFWELQQHVMWRNDGKPGT